jgi:hypothetical protein
MTPVRWIDLAGIILTFLTAVIGFVVALRRIQAVHVLVNAQLKAVMDRLGIEVARTAQLKDSMKDQGADVPPRPGTDEAGERTVS